MLPGHSAVYYKGGVLADPDATLYVRTTWNIDSSGQFWLSPTPDKPFSTGFANHGLQEPRVFVWAKLRERSTGKPLLVGCTHFDNNPPSQELSADLAIERLEGLRQGEYADAPVLVMGDFNSQNVSTPSFGSSAHFNNSEAFKRLTGTGDARGRHALALVETCDLAASRQVVNRTAAHKVAQPPWPASEEPLGGERIDHVFVYPSQSFAVHSYVVDDTAYGPKGRTPSDHRPVAVSLSLRVSVQRAGAA